jgi:DNA-binding MarR family transcriptional regulator
MSTSGQETGENLVNTLVQLSFGLQMILGRAGAKLDLSIIQVRLLGILRDREPTMLELARYLSLDKSSITGLVDRAERRGLVRRTAAPEDGRSTRVVLTPPGRRTIRAVAHDVAWQVSALVEDFSEADRKRLSVLSNRILLHDAATKGLDLLAGTFNDDQRTPAPPW